MHPAPAPKKTKGKFYTNLTFQVLTAITIGVLLGHFVPDLAVKMKPLGEAFIRLVKMVIGPIVFITVVTGISSMGDMKKVGKVGGKALLYFEVVTTFALAIGLIVVNLIGPGRGMHVVQGQVDAKAVAKYAAAAHEHDTVSFILNLIPENVVSAFEKGDLLQILLFSILFGVALAAMGDRGKMVEGFLEKVGHVMFGVIGIVMRVAPLGAFGAMSYTIGKYGVSSLASLGQLMASVYITMALFVFVVLGSIARIYNFSLWRFLRYIKDELLIVLGTSSSESALPRMMDKLQRFGCAKPVVGLVIPTGYSFNLDGTSIYLSMAAIFIAQAYDIDLTLTQQLSILAVLLLTSKGAAAVTGGGFITLAATLSATGTLPIEGLALLLGVDRFMSEARAITNLIGNGVATIVVAKMEKEFDESKAVEEYQSHFREPALAAI
ncbi:dicarboxylate/amino acid:cation symporter [Magnetospirillum aberrantis]|uniref:Dicarboxylate/amino acid:cation symporter n=1 Tax=Magnetospirillum aberrantis SpK TaxID=908842 RepID=A0A7C9UU60_9PROT|nr:dicarboxylate/amino acid:cation symporter [Magnetospirillum aberrantis]NFV80066.1 dicarboxylate/amino acid:cation symporter [Magnetospirillum aberrantis SpK]